MADERPNLDKQLYLASGDAGFYTGKYELMGTWEVAAYLGVEKSRIARWVDRNAIEAPVAKLKSAPLWTLEQVRNHARVMYRQETGRDAASDDALDRWLKARRRRRNGAAPSRTPAAAAA